MTSEQPEGIKFVPKQVDHSAKQPVRSRMMVVEQIVVSSDDKPLEFTPSFVRTLEHGEEQAIARKIKVTSEWQPLDLLWFADCPERVGQLVIRNDEGKGLYKNLSEEDKAATAKRVIEVGLCIGHNFHLNAESVIDFGQCLPGESGPRIDPRNLHLYRIRHRLSSQEVIKATLFLVPR